MDISPVPELIAELAAGRMVILVDDEDRENEGDVVLAADCVSAEAINFMAKHCRGLICLTLTRERCQQLDLPPMVVRNDAKHGTAFTVSVEAAEGIDNRHLRRRPGADRARGRGQGRQGQRPGAPRPHLPAAGGRGRGADARRPHRGRLRPGRHGRAEPRRRDLRGDERRRHHGPAARPAPLCRRAWPEAGHHRRADPLPQPPRDAGARGAPAPAGHAPRCVRQPAVPRQLWWRAPGADLGQLVARCRGAGAGARAAVGAGPAWTPRAAATAGRCHWRFRPSSAPGPAWC